MVGEFLSLWSFMLLPCAFPDVRMLPYDRQTNDAVPMVEQENMNLLFIKRVTGMVSSKIKQRILISNQGSRFSALFLALW